MSVRIGYACISIPMREKGIFASRTMRLDTFAKFGLERAKELALANIADLAKLIEYNESIGIRFFRITSNLFPHMENYKVSSELLSGYNLDFAEAELRKVGELARKYGHRLTFHPGQFAQLGSPSEGVVDQTFRDLNLHARIFQIMGLKPEDGSVMIIHGGGSYGDKDAALRRWRERFRKLPPTTQQYIALENDEYQYSPADLLPLCEELSIPFCLDFFHLKCMIENESKYILESKLTHVPADVLKQMDEIGDQGKILRLEKGIGPVPNWGTPDDEVDLINGDKIPLKKLQMPGEALKETPFQDNLFAKNNPFAGEINIIAKYTTKNLMMSKYEETISDKEFMDRIARTWTRRSIKQKVHVSTQKEGERLGTHGDYIVPDEINFKKILEICNYYGADIMAECKQKDVCALALLEKFFIKVPTSDGKFYWSYQQWQKMPALPVGKNFF